jgi:hypothetical protein
MSSLIYNYQIIEHRWTVERWCQRFKAGNFFDDENRPGRLLGELAQVISQFLRDNHFSPDPPW